MTNVPPTTTTASAASVRLPPIHLLSGDDPPTLALPHTSHSSLFNYHYHPHHQQDRYHRQPQHTPPRQLMSTSPLPSTFNSRRTSSTSSSTTTGINALTLAAKQEDEISLSLSDEDMLLCDEADDEENWSDAAPSSIEGAASGAEVRDKRGSAASSGAGGGSGVAEGNSIGKRNSNNRSRRLLSLEQSKVLYKILDKTHFPSTQLREAAASQLGVSPRKVQVWFQNRRQVGKKRMMESVQSLLSTYPPSSSAQLSLDHIQDQLRSTGKTRFSANEDERTRAWRRHTIRLALNPSAAEEEESKAAIRELERGSSAREYYEMHPGAERDRDWGRDAAAAMGAGYTARGFGWSELEGRDSRIRASRSAATLRINVPRLRSHSSTSDSHTLATVSTPTYTGPGSATHLESISSARTYPSPLTAPTTRSILTTPTINSQKECFSIPTPNVNLYRPYPRPSLPPPPQPFAHNGVRRDRSATLSAGTMRWQDSDLRQVRNDLTAEWRAQQRLLHHHQSVDSRRVSPPNGRYSPYHLEGRRGRSESSPIDPTQRMETASPINSRIVSTSSQQDRPSTEFTSPNDSTKQNRHHPESVTEHKGSNSRMDVRSLTTSNITNTRAGR